MEIGLIRSVPGGVSRLFGRRSRYTGLTILLAVALAACGGGTNGGVEIAGLQGERKEFDLSSVPPAADLGPAPTDAHGRLASLLPREALAKSSVVYSDWDQNSALPAGDAAKAVMPTVQAEYRSMGYKLIVDDKKAPQGKARTEMEYPQEASLVVVQAPEARAAEAVVERLRKHFKDKGFSVEEPMLMADGRTVGGVKIERFLRIDSGVQTDKVYVAYVLQIGQVVAYAVEIEEPPPIKAGDGTQAKRVMNDQGGSRLGAQLIVLVQTRATS